MRFRSPAVLFALLVVAAGLAGCVGRGQESVQTGGDITPTVTPPAIPTGPLAHFVVGTLTIRPPDGVDRQLREDDGAAIVRYVVSQPTDAPTETAFVTYIVNGRIVDVQNLKLGPGESKEFERRIERPAVGSDIKVEVRAGASVVQAAASVVAWPRPGEPLALGPLTVRLDYGLMERDGRVLVNVTLDHTGPEAPIKDFRVKMVCQDASGQLQPTASVRPELPTYGNVTGVDVLLDDCAATRYALEFKADGEDEVSYYGRILLVAPPQA